MCLIAIKPRGVKVTDAWYKSLENGFAGNSDGAGFTIKQYTGLNKVYGYDLHKGTKEDNFTLDYMMNLLQDTYKLGEEDEVMCHFRIRTQGSISQENCHPFIMDERAIDEVDGFENKYPALAHNGGFFIKACYAKMSDTYTFVKDFAKNPHNMDYLFKYGPEFFNNNYVQLDNIGTINLEHIGISYNKIAIMFPEQDKNIMTIGDFVTDEDTKCMYSHSGYKSSFHRDYGGSSFGLLGDRRSTHESSLNVVKREPDYAVSNKKPFSMELSSEYLKAIEEYKEQKKIDDEKEAERKKLKTSYLTKQQHTTQEHTVTRDTAWTNTIFINKDNKDHFELKVRESFDLFDKDDILLITDYNEPTEQYHVKWKSTDGNIMCSIYVSKEELISKSTLLIKPEFREFYSEYFKFVNLVSRASKNVRKKLNRKMEDARFKKKLAVRLMGFNNHGECNVSVLQMAIDRVLKLEKLRDNKFSKSNNNQLCLVN